MKDPESFAADVHDVNAIKVVIEIRDILLPPPCCLTVTMAVVMSDPTSKYAPTSLVPGPEIPT